MKDETKAEEIVALIGWVVVLLGLVWFIWG